MRKAGFHRQPELEGSAWVWPHEDCAQPGACYLRVREMDVRRAGGRGGCACVGGAVAAILGLLLPACGDGNGGGQQGVTDPCAAFDAKVEACGLVSTRPGGICAQEGGPCYAECALSATCDEIESGNWPMEALICFLDCEPRQECADGSATIRQSWVCDFEQDCLDGSDEVGCIHFLCDDGTGVPDAYLCDGDMDCPGGEDEWEPC